MVFDPSGGGGISYKPVFNFNELAKKIRERLDEKK